MTLMNLEALRQRVRADEDTPSTLETIRNSVTARRAERGGHTEWGLLCEEAGLLSLAFSEFQLALRDDRRDTVAIARLAQHYHERGDVARAVGLLSQLMELLPTDLEVLEQLVALLREDGAEPRAAAWIDRAVEAGLAPESAARLRRQGRKESGEEGRKSVDQQADLVPTDADCIRFHTLFGGREGVYARQWAKRGGEVGYSPVQEPLTPQVIRNHLLGNYTVGSYVLRLDATATFFVLDLDIDKVALQRAHGDHAYAQSLRETMRQEGPRLLNGLRELGFLPLFENSGYKGRHYWVFLEQPAPAEVLHLLGRLFLAWQSPRVPPGFHLEFFPKQASLRGKGLGNLIKLPLGIHRRTGYRSSLLDDQGVARSDPFQRLREVVRADQATVHHAISRLKSWAELPGPMSAERVEGTDAHPPSEGRSERPGAVAAPKVPPRSTSWTEADFEADARVRHLLGECPVLAEVKQSVDEHRRLNHEEQLVLIHSLGHLEGGPQAVNYLFQKCVDVGPEKFMKDRLKGNPVSCPSIRKKIPHITRRVACNCPFEFAKDRYPTPVLHLLTLPAAPQAGPVESPELGSLAQRFGILERRRAELEKEWEGMRDALAQGLHELPDRSIACPGGRYRLVDREGVAEIRWEADEAAEPVGEAAAASPAHLGIQVAKGKSQDGDPTQEGSGTPVGSEQPPA